MAVFIRCLYVGQLFASWPQTAVLSATDKQLRYASRLVDQLLASWPQKTALSATDKQLRYANRFVDQLFASWPGNCHAVAGAL